MKVSGQIHTAIILPSAKEHPLHIEQDAGRAAEQSGRGSEDKSPCSWWGNESQSYSLAANNLATIQLSSSAY